MSPARVDTETRQRGEVWMADSVFHDSAQMHEAPDDLLAAIDYCYEQGWTDGLPVVPPEASRVETMLAADGR